MHSTGTNLSICPQWCGNSVPPSFTADQRGKVEILARGQSMHMYWRSRSSKQNRYEWWQRPNRLVAAIYMLQQLFSTCLVYGPSFIKKISDVPLCCAETSWTRGRKCISHWSVNSRAFSIKDLWNSLWTTKISRWTTWRITGLYCFISF